MAGGASAPVSAQRTRSPLAAPGVLLGVGLGGFVDGIVLHQVLQWHHLLSSAETSRLDIGSFPVDTVRGLEVNTLWDGLFHALTWLAVLAGVALLYSRTRTAAGRSGGGRVLSGWVLLGWGGFNLVEGLVNHHLLAIHHVRAGPDQVLYDVGFLLLGGALVVGGWLLQRSAARA
jgi:uncharacterized membrane protein